MSNTDYERLCWQYLEELCEKIADRSTGSLGNMVANNFFATTLQVLNWEVELSDLPVLDWQDEGASLYCEGIEYSVQSGPYGLACSCEGIILPLHSLDELEISNIKGKIVLLYGEITQEQLMPKNFVFYNPEEHQKIINLLEQGQPLAVLSATGRNAALAGGVYPFPLIEDGDFNIPTAYMTAEEGERLQKNCQGNAKLMVNSHRMPVITQQVIARNSPTKHKRIVVSAHIDAKKGSPGALDNASGVVILLLLAHMLEKQDTLFQVELVAFNGEDYYSAPGQMLYLQQQNYDLSEILLNINIDGAGYHAGGSAYSFFDLSPEWKRTMTQIIAQEPDMEEGEQWVQGDHSIFIQYGRPAIAVTSKWFLDNIDRQEITHTPQDKIGNVDPRKLVKIAWVISQFLINLEGDV